MRAGSRAVTLLVGFFLAFSALILAQTATTSLRGTVYDAKGAVVQVDLWHTSPPKQVTPGGRYPPIPEAAIDEVVETLNQTFRRLRQTSIDEELFDVLSGYESLSKGTSPC